MVRSLSCRKVWLSSVCWPLGAKPSNQAECRIYGEWVKSSIWRRLWAKVHEILGWRRGPLVLCDILARLSTSCIVHKIFATKSQSRRKTEQMENLLVPNFLEGMTPIFLRQIVSAIYCTPFVLVEFYLLISVCEAWEWSRMQNLRRVGKMTVQF